MTLRRCRHVLAAMAALMFAGLGTAQAQEPSAIRIGYAISKTGPYAGGANATTLPNYQLWVDEVNKAGGIQVGDRRLPLEVVEYDDRSNSEEAVRAIERLINQDKVDFILPPWGTALNLAVGPVFDRAGYPQLAVTSVTNMVPQLSKRWKNAFFFGDTSSNYAKGVVEVLTQLRESGQVEGNVAMINVADQFGIELTNAARPALEQAGFKIVYNQSYPIGTQDMQSIVNEMRRRNPDIVLAFSYPPDTIAFTDQAKTLGLNPTIFYTAVGTAFPLFKQRFGESAEGVMGTGGIDTSSQAIQDYMRRHQEVLGKEPDRWLSPVTYASLQVLQQAIERAGTLDRKAVAQEIHKGGFDTVVGTISLDDQVYNNGWMVGQWQDGEFRALSPLSANGVQTAKVPKPEWK